MADLGLIPGRFGVDPGPIKRLDLGSDGSGAPVLRRPLRLPPGVHALDVQHVAASEAPGGLAQGHVLEADDAGALLVRPRGAVLVDLRRQRDLGNGARSAPKCAPHRSRAPLPNRFQIATSLPECRAASPTPHRPRTDPTSHARPGSPLERPRAAPSHLSSTADPRSNPDRARSNPRTAHRSPTDRARIDPGWTRHRPVDPRATPSRCEIDGPLLVRHIGQ